jgi:UDP:flavonoid glycosyltransferase YjiC (YdhE family)
MRAEQPGSPTEDPNVDWITAKLARYGLGYDEHDLIGHATLDVMPSWMRFDVTGEQLPMRYVPYNGPAEVPGWLREPAPRPRVCFTLGVSGREVWAGKGSIRAQDLFDAVGDLDLELVATLNADQLGDDVKVPDNVRLVDFVPLNSLLPGCSAIVQHGGTGTTLTALVHGVPQLIVPAALYDEAGVAAQLAGRGAAVVIDPAELSTETLRAGLVRLLEDPAFRSGAEAVRAEMEAAPTPHDVVAQLADVVARHSRSGD